MAKRNWLGQSKDVPRNVERLTSPSIHAAWVSGISYVGSHVMFARKFSRSPKPTIALIRQATLIQCNLGGESRRPPPEPLNDSSWKSSLFVARTPSSLSAAKEEERSVHIRCC